MLNFITLTDKPIERRFVFEQVKRIWLVEPGYAGGRKKDQYGRKVFNADIDRPNL